MLKTTVTPEKAQIQFSIPAEYIGRKLEVLLYPVDEVTEQQSTKPSVTMEQFKGILDNETAERLQKEITKSREEWDRDI